MIGTALLAAVCIGAAAALIVRGLSMPRVRAVRQLEQIGAYGFAGAGVEGVPGERLGFVERLGGMIAAPLGRERVRSIHRQLMSAGMHTTSAEGYLGRYALTFVGVMLLTILFVVALAPSTGVAFVLLCAGVATGWLLPRVSLARRARHRLERIDYEIPELVDLLLVGIESGMGFNGAMRVSSTRVEGPLGEELRLMLQQQSLGASTVESLENLLDRNETPAVRSFVRTISQGERLGVSIGQMMRSLAEEMRKRRRSLAEERAQKTPVKIVFPLVFLLLPAMFLIVLVPAFINFSDTVSGI